MGSLWSVLLNMAAIPIPTVPTGDVALDGRGREWRLTVPADSPYGDLWLTADGAGATTAHLTANYGRITFFRSAELQVSA